VPAVSYLRLLPANASSLFVARARVHRA
jgi:hypothetical protein